MALKDYSDINVLISGFNKILSLDSVGSPPPIPTILILVGVPRRTGLSAIKIASEIITRKSEAGLTVGNLPSGEISPDEIMERIRMDVLIKHLQQDAIVSVAIPAGTTLTASGISAVGGPVSVFGLTTKITKGYGIIQ